MCVWGGDIGMGDSNPDIKWLNKLTEKIKCLKLQNVEQRHFEKYPSNNCKGLPGNARYQISSKLCSFSKVIFIKTAAHLCKYML